MKLNLHDRPYLPDGACEPLTNRHRVVGLEVLPRKECLSATVTRLCVVHDVLSTL